MIKTIAKLYKNWKEHKARNKVYIRKEVVGLVQKKYQWLKEIGNKTGKYQQKIAEKKLTGRLYNPSNFKSQSKFKKFYNN